MSSFSDSVLNILLKYYIIFKNTSEKTNHKFKDKVNCNKNRKIEEFLSTRS